MYLVDKIFPNTHPLWRVGNSPTQLNLLLVAQRGYSLSKCTQLACCITWNSALVFLLLVSPLSIAQSSFLDENFLTQYSFYYPCSLGINLRKANCQVSVASLLKARSENQLHQDRSPSSLSMFFAFHINTGDSVAKLSATREQASLSFSFQ